MTGPVANTSRTSDGHETPGGGAAGETVPHRPSPASIPRETRRAPCRMPSGRFRIESAAPAATCSPRPAGGATMGWTIWAGIVPIGLVGAVAGWWLLRRPVRRVVEEVRFDH